MAGIWVALSACTNGSGGAIDRPFREKPHSRDITPFYKWTDVLQRMDSEMKAQGFFSKNTGLAQSVPALETIKRANEIVNSFGYVPDQDGWHKYDYWQTPAEFFKRGGGDCEDFVITKYALLKKLGVQERDMRIAVVQDKIRKQIHTLLLVNMEGRTLVLDNQEKNTRIADQQMLARYKPIFSFNRQAWWLY